MYNGREYAYVSGQKNGVGKWFLLAEVNTAEELWFYF